MFNSGLMGESFLSVPLQCGRIGRQHLLRSPEDTAGAAWTFAPGPNGRWNCSPPVRSTLAACRQKWARPRRHADAGAARLSRRMECRRVGHPEDQRHRASRRLVRFRARHGGRTGAAVRRRHRPLLRGHGHRWPADRQPGDFHRWQSVSRRPSGLDPGWPRHRQPQGPDPQPATQRRFPDRRRPRHSLRQCRYCRAGLAGDHRRPQPDTGRQGPPGQRRPDRRQARHRRAAPASSSASAARATTPPSPGAISTPPIAPTPARPWPASQARPSRPTSANWPTGCARSTTARPTRRALSTRCRRSSSASSCARSITPS